MCVLRLSRLILLGLVLWSATAEAATYYVATNGNDGNNGTSLSTPFRTIGKAANIVNPGDVVNVRGGTYVESVCMTRSGTLAQPITFQRYQNEVPIMNGAGLALGTDCLPGLNFPNGPGVATNGGLVLKGASNIIIDGFTVKNYRVPSALGANIHLQATNNGPSHTIIRNCELSGFSGADNPAGFKITDYYAGTVEVSNNVIHDNGDGLSGDHNWLGIETMMDSLPGGATSFVWYHNNEVYNEGAGISYKHGSPVASAATAIIEKNLIHDIVTGSQVGGCIRSEQPNVIIRNNICYNRTQAGSAAFFLGTVGSNKNCTGCQVYNNSVYNVASLVFTYAGSTGANIHDNIISTTGPGHLLMATTGLKLNFNLYAGAAASLAAIWNYSVGGQLNYIFALLQTLGFEANGLTGNPMYVNPTGNPRDFHLQPGSPAKGAGTGGLDMGAYPTGTEVIGPTIGGGGGDLNPPIPPQNLQVN